MRLPLEPLAATFDAGGRAAGRRLLPPGEERPGWVLAVHGGAGLERKTLPPSLELEIRRGLETALRCGRDLLAQGGVSLDAVEAVVRTLEEDPVFNAGKGAAFTHAGTHELDAAIMDGRDRSAGGVAAVRTVRNPVHLARLVMEATAHVLLVGEGAEAFADEMKVERVANDWFDTPLRRRELAAELAAPELTPPRPGTVGAVALDRHGHLAAATSTGGTCNKLPGRVGDTPVPGAGTWADDRTCAVSCTGRGEAFLRGAAAARVSMLMEYRGLSLLEAASEVISRVLAPRDGGLIAIAPDGAVAMPFSVEGMSRGFAAASGRFEVAIWQQEG